MRIGIDVRMIFSFPTGIGNYRWSLIKTLLELDSENEYLVIGNEGNVLDPGNMDTSFYNNCYIAEKEVSAFYANKKISFVPIKSKANSPLQHFSLAAELKTLNLDVFYTTPWGAVLGIPCKYVLEIPDLIYHHYPKFGSWKSRLYELFLEKSIAENAAHIVTISNFVKTDIHNYLGVDLGKISNMKGSVSSDYRVINDSGFVSKVLEKYGLITPTTPSREVTPLLSPDRRTGGQEGKGPVLEHLMIPYFVYLGNQRPHKNLVSLLKAFERFKDSLSQKLSSPTTPSQEGTPLLGQEGKIRLVIIGGVDASGRDADSLRIQEQLGKMKFKNDVQLLGKVFDNNEVAVIFNRAIAMVHPSLHEGFGMTPLEAMRCGCPVITSNVTAMPEVVADAGIQVDPMDEKEIADAMSEIFKNENLRKGLSYKSLKQSELFSWEKTARILLDVFSKLK